MKKLVFNSESYEAEKIVKTETDIVGYNGNVEVFAFRGISDFSGFEIESGQVFDKSDDDLLKERLVLMQAAIDDLILGGVK